MMGEPIIFGLISDFADEGNLQRATDLKSGFDAGDRNLNYTYDLQTIPKLCFSDLLVKSITALVWL